MTRPLKFKAHCRKGHALFETEDAAAFEAHMKAEHDGPLDVIYASPSGGYTYNKTHRLPVAVPVKLWPAKPKKGRPDGGVFKRKVETKTCVCGFVIEDNGTYAAGLFLVEHERGCAVLRARLAA